MAQQYTFEIQRVINGSSPDKELVVLKATAAINTKGFALVDRTFEENGKVSNEFRHIFVFPELELATGETVIVCTGKGKNGMRELKNGKTFYALYWGSEECVWNDKGGDRASLINFVPINSVIVPAVTKA
jgi:hypothetical protein